MKVKYYFKEEDEFPHVIDIIRGICILCSICGKTLDSIKLTAKGMVAELHQDEDGNSILDLYDDIEAM